MKKKLLLLLLLPFTLLSQTYNFSYDEDGLIPTNITELNGSIKVFTHPTEGKTMEGKVIASGQTVVANLDLFPNSNNYYITWKETYTTARRSGFILRANGSNSITPGLKKGYLFQVNSATNNVRIYKSNSSSFTLLSDKNLTAPGLNSPRWYKASVNGNILSFDYSTDGVSFINLITTKDYTYTSGKTQYSIGYGRGAGNLYVDDIKLSVIHNNSITINNIKPYQVFQRDSLGKADIIIEGNYTGAPLGIEAKWNSSQIWTPLVIDSNGEGTFSGMLQNRSQGQGQLEVRFTNNTSIIKTIENIGIGDIFVIAGQSNASGRGFTLNSYSHSNLKACLFGNDYKWKELVDAVDDNSGQIDIVSNDSAAKGSPWPILATNVMQSHSIPIAFIPTAKGGSSILEWQPSSNHSDPSTLYGSMNRRIKAAGGKVKAILFYQGERDAFSNTSQTNYEQRLNQFVNTVAADFPGIKVIIGQIGHADNTGLDRIRKAQFKVINSNPNAILGPATYDIKLSDENGDFLHFKSDKDMLEFSRRWYMTLNQIYYSGVNGYGPILDINNIIYNYIDNKIIVPFTDEKTPAINIKSTVSPDSFDLNNNGSVNISAVNIKKDIVEITPSSILDITKPIKISYASLNKGVNKAIYDMDNLPAQNFYDVIVKMEKSIKTLPNYFNRNIHLYPNPVEQKLFIRFQNSVNVINIKIYDIHRKLVLTDHQVVENNITRLNLSILEKGIYYIFIEAGQEIISQKLLKK